MFRSTLLLYIQTCKHDLLRRSLNVNSLGDGYYSSVNVRSIYNDGVTDGKSQATSNIIKALSSDYTVLGETIRAGEQEITKHYDISFNGHKYMAIIGAALGQYWYDMEQLSGYFTYPYINQYVNGVLVTSCKASEAASGGLYKCVLSAENNETLSFDITYKHNEEYVGQNQTIKLSIIWYD